ncbi:hypothetical protein DKL61_00070 [Gammaproteobacteria bacterium ESL0073]|nr:hypothetical protein DKL61_00070 [Gammaproteobacteria bacterium ESL0073]
MKLQHSRQVWHDAYYPNIKSANVWGEQVLAFSHYPCKALKHYHDYQLMHNCLAGKVQQAISTLPKALQSFGHYLYSPLSTQHDLKVTVQLINSIYRQQASVVLSQQQQTILSYLVLLAINNYRNFAMGQKKLIKTLKKISQQLQVYGQTILLENEWKSLWQNLYNQLLSICEELDKKALIPVEQLIKEIKQNYK